MDTLSNSNIEKDDLALERFSVGARTKLEKNSSKGVVTVGDYHVGKSIGEGTFGKVHLGRHMQSDEKVALKFVERKTAMIQKNIDRETKIMKLISHPNIVTLYEVIDMPKTNSTCMVLEYINGGELFDYIINKERLVENEAVLFFRQMVSAMDYCHANLVVHRDLKPENILLDQNNQVKIMDFGLANVMNLVDTLLLHTNCGSPIYCAPEILQAKDYVGPEVDVWSLGVVLYVMVTGCCPWTGSTLTEQVRKAVFGRYEPIDGYVSPACADLIKRMLTADPKKRATLAEVMNHPWYTQGGTPVQSLMSQRQRVTEINPEILKQLEALGFGKTEVEYDVLNHKTMKQSFVLYHLIGDQIERNMRLSMTKEPGRLIRTKSGNFRVWNPTRYSKMKLIEESSKGDSPKEEVESPPVTPNTSPKRSSSSSPKSSPSSPGGGSGFFSSIRRKIDVRRRSFVGTETSKSGSFSKPVKLKVVKGALAIDKVTSKPTQEIHDEVERTLKAMQITYVKKGEYKWTLKDVVNHTYKIELRICQIDKSDFKGIKLKRKQGSVWSYKELANKICYELNI